VANFVKPGYHIYKIQGLRPGAFSQALWVKWFQLVHSPTEEVSVRRQRLHHRRILGLADALEACG
jgi:hypothetical protein